MGGGGKIIMNINGAFMNTVETRVMMAIHGEKQYNEVIKCCQGGM